MNQTLLLCWVRLNAVPGINIDEDQIVEEESELNFDTDADPLSSSKRRIIAKLIPIFLLGLVRFWLFFTSPWSFLSPSLFLSGYNILSLAVLIYLALKVLRFFKEGINECNSSFFQTKLLFYSGLLLCSMTVLSPLRSMRR